MWWWKNSSFTTPRRFFTSLFYVNWNFFRVKRLEWIFSCLSVALRDEVSLTMNGSAAVGWKENRSFDVEWRAQGDENWHEKSLCLWSFRVARVKKRSTKQKVLYHRIELFCSIKISVAFDVKILESWFYEQNFQRISRKPLSLNATNVVERE